MAGLNLGGRRDWEVLRLLPSAARTTSGTVELGMLGGPVDYLFFVANVSAASGTSPTVQFDLEGTVDGTNWFTLDNLTSASGSINVRNKLTSVVSGFGFTPRMRIKYTIAGTNPSLTFDVNVVAVTGG